MAVSHNNVLSFWQLLWCAETDVDTQNNSEDDIFLFAATGIFMRRDISRINDYFEVTVPRYQPDVFRSHFRMTRRTFELLVHMIGPSEHIPKGNSFGRPAVDPRKQIAMSLWMMANQETHRQIADRFDVSLSSVSRCFRRVCKALVDLLPDLVKWPIIFINKLNEIKTLFFFTTARERNVYRQQTVAGSK